MKDQYKQEFETRMIDLHEKLQKDDYYFNKNSNFETICGTKFCVTTTVLFCNNCLAVEWETQKGTESSCSYYIVLKDQSGAFQTKYIPSKQAAQREPLLSALFEAKQTAADQK